MGSLFDEALEDAELYVSVEISIDTAKTVAPLAVRPAASTDSKVTALSGTGSDSKYKTMTKYTFYEDKEKYVKVLLDFPDAKKLLTKDNLVCTFEERSFTLLVNDYKGEYFKFAVPKLHCRILPPDCSFSLKSNNVQVTLRKKNQADHWWSLFK